MVNRARVDCMEIDEAVEKICRGTAEVIDIQWLEAKLRLSHEKGKPLRVKAGFDPTAPDIHLGHVVLLRKLRQFQDLGHKVFFLIGDFTAQVGDPTGRDQLRPRLSRAQIEENAETYKLQAFKVLDPEKTEVVFNSGWLSRLTAQDILELTAHSTVAQMLARADFKKRYDARKEISILEFIYPLLQGYDSIYLKADVELGGSDQKFNLLMARELQKAYGQAPEVLVMTPLLEGTDGVQKMSKSLGNYIGINEPASEMFGKLMSIGDELMYKYFECLTDCDLAEVKSMHPKDAKLKLAEEIVSQFHGDGCAKEAKASFEKVFSKKELPDDIPEYAVAVDDGEPIIDVLVKTGMSPSKNEVRRLIRQGAVSVDGRKISNDDFLVRKGVVRIGKRRFLRLV